MSYRLGNKANPVSEDHLMNFFRSLNMNSAQVRTAYLQATARTAGLDC